MVGLKDKVAVITGGSSGIGAACVHRLVDEGAFVVIAGRDEKRSQEIGETSSAPDHVSAVVGDLRDIAICNHVIETTINLHGHLDILINSAGTSVYKPFMEITEADFDMVVNTNLKAVCFTIQAALHYMLPRRQGVIINITSVAGLIGFVNQQVYNASKGGLELLSRSLAKELGPQGIRVMSVAPGVIESPMTDKWAASAPDPEAFRRSSEEEYPLRRFGRPEEVASVVAFLASNQSDWVTGCSWLIDGGLLA